MARKQVKPERRKSKRAPLKDARALKSSGGKKRASVAARQVMKPPVRRRPVAGRTDGTAAPKTPAPIHALLAISGSKMAKSPLIAMAPKMVKASTSPAPQITSPPVPEPEAVSTLAETPEEAAEEIKDELRVHEEGEG